MNLDTDQQKVALTKQVISILKKNVDASQTKMAALYVEQCFRRVPFEDLVKEAPQTLAAIVIGQLEFSGKEHREKF